MELMKSTNEKYIQALCALREDDFTKSILKPLFESMGFERVDFNGGPYERGRDLIAQRRIPPSKEMYVVYVQSKKIGNIQNTKTAEKLSALLHQLRQCCAGELTDSEGRKITPSQVYLACPEQISNRLLEEIGSQLYNSPMKVVIYDGPRIISDIKEFKLELLGLLTNIGDRLTSNSDLNHNNKELLSALKSTNTSRVNDFYSDLSFFVGSFDSNLLLHLDIQFKDDKLNIADENWTSSRKELEEILEKYEVCLFNESIYEIEERFKKNKRDYESKSNQDNKRICRELHEKISEFTIRINNYIKTLTTSLDTNINPRAKALSNEELLEREDAIAYLRKIESSQKNETLNKFNKKGNSFYEDADIALSLTYERNKLKLDLVNRKAKIIEDPYYKVNINTQEIIENLEFFKKQYNEGIDLINKKQLSIPGLKKFLYKTQKTLSFVSKLSNESSPLSKVILFKIDENYQDRVSISPHDIFSTGHDIAVYGGAGVGKTTTLKAYADAISASGNNNLIYIALNKLVDEFKKTVSQTTEKNSSRKDLLIRIILLSRGINPTNENIEDARKIIANNLTLILDGLDEVYNTIPNIITAISQFKASNPNAQLIVSSRDCVSYLGDIDFLGITLLPFTKDQLNRFIRGWLKDKEKADALIESIQDRDLFEHVKTPLLATITCSLVEKGINAPSTENEIYSERLRLLTGEYDLHKNIERQKQKGELLRKCATKIAFYMHTRGFRSLPKSEMLNALYLDLFENYSRELLAECLEELINPCNVIILDPVTSKYSFGHFRFQEHLASEELKLNRSIDLSELATNDWWRGALALYSQDNDISYLIEDIYKRYDSVKKARITLELMIANSPQQKRNGLKSLLTEYIRSDQMDNLFLITDDNYYDDYESI
jgi:flagellar biosynthesis GTPase FlhF